MDIVSLKRSPQCRPPHFAQPSGPGFPLGTVAARSRCGRYGYVGPAHQRGERRANLAHDIALLARANTSG